MEFFKKKKQVPAAVQTAPPCAASKHPFGILETAKHMREPEIMLYQTLKEAVPIIDAAISKIIRLTGEFKIKCSDDETEKKLNKFVSKVQVNSCGKGLNTFILTYLNQLLTYGTAVGEIVMNKECDSIAALYNASLKNVKLKVNSSPLKLDIYRKTAENSFEKIKYPSLILVSALNPEPGNVYGNSVMKGLPFISNILLKIYNSIGLNWERVGNVRFAVTYKPSSDAGERAYSRERASQIASEWSKAMQSSSTPSDFIAIGDVDIKVIGADNQILESRVPVRQMLEQIVSKLSIPPFLLGLSWSTTETMSTQQSDILSSELEAYRRLLNPVIERICDMWLKINGIETDYTVAWQKIDLKDNVHMANARLLNARAMQIEKNLEKEYSEPYENII